MKSKFLPIFLAVAGGVVIGWIVRGTGSAEHEVRISEKVRDSGSRTVRSRAKASSSERVDVSRPVSQWLPRNESTFLDPKSQTDRAEVQRLVRGAIEKEPNYHSRMKAVADLLALMTPENAHDIRDAFLNSRKDGFWYGTERKVFLARYGEVLGGEAMEEFKDDPDFVRVLESWALIEGPEAVDWVNEMEPGDARDSAIGRLIGAFGSTDVSYAIDVFASLTESEQSLHQNALTEAAIRSGGKEACAELAEDLLKRDDGNLRRAGQRVLAQAFDLYMEFDGSRSWLQSLSPEHLALLDQSKLPEEFRSIKAE